MREISDCELLSGNTPLRGAIELRQLDRPIAIRVALTSVPHERALDGTREDTASELNSLLTELAPLGGGNH